MRSAVSEPLEWGLMGDRMSSGKKRGRERYQKHIQAQKQNNSSMAKIKERNTIKQHYTKHNIENKNWKFSNMNPTKV